MSDAPPPDIECLLREHIASVGTLELLLLLRDDDSRARQIGDISSALGSPSSWTELQLEELTRGGMVAGNATDGWCYAPISARLAGTVDALASEWSRDPGAVSRWIFRRERSRSR
jgi:hypothetical protein